MEELAAKTPFLVRTESHEGPLELILELIEKRKLSISEIALSEITDEFIAHIRGQGSFPMEEASAFIAVAATLLLIKSRSLIPELELSEEEEEDVEDLKRRLTAYEHARDAARELGRLFGLRPAYSRGDRAPEAIFAPSRDLSADALVAALASAYEAHEKTREEKLPEARVRATISIEDMMDRLHERVKSALTLSFKEFSGTAKERVEVIVSFLALLELVKQGAVEIQQHAVFGDITISNTTSSTPHYG